MFFLTPDGTTAEARRKTRTAEPVAPPTGTASAESKEGGGNIGVDELAQELINHLDEEGADWMSGWGGDGAADGGADALAAAGHVPAAGSGYDSSDFQAAGPQVDDEALARALAEASTDESDEDEEDEGGDDDAAASGDDDDSADAAEGEDDAKPKERWKVKGLAGIVYDFPDVTALRRFIGSRESHDGIEVSRDGGETWSTVAEVPELSDVNPAIVKQRKPAPTQDTTAAKRRKGGARGKAAPNRPTAPITPPPSAAAKSTNRAWMWLVLLIFLLGALATAHALQIIDIPFLRGDTGETTSQAMVPPPEHDARADQAADPRDGARDDDAPAAQRRVRGVEGLYAEMLEEANRLSADAAYDDAIRLLHRARATMPNRSDAWCAEVSILERAERDADAARDLCTEARNAEAEGRAMNIPEGLVVVDDSITQPGEMIEVMDDEEEDADEAPSPDGASADEP